MGRGCCQHGPGRAAGLNPLPPAGTGTDVPPPLHLPPPGAAARRGYRGQGSQILAGSFGSPRCRRSPFSSNFICRRWRARPSIPILILILVPRYPGRAQPSCGRAGGCWPSAPAPTCARRRNGQGSSSSALSDFSNDRFRSLGQVGKAAEPPHAPRHAACKTSEQEGWKPYRIIQGKASRPAAARGRTGARTCCGPLRNGAGRWRFWGRKGRLNQFSVAMRHSGFGKRWGHCAGQDCGKNAPRGENDVISGGWGVGP